MRNEIEHSEQVTLMQWWALACHGFGVPEACLFAIPNGGERNVIVASKLKAEGVRAGVPDLFLACGSSCFNGLFIEMKKTRGGRVSEAQRAYLDMLTERGYLAVVCNGWLEAKQIIEQYLKGQNHAQ